jgi:hypothetical protein
MKERRPKGVKRPPKPTDRPASPRIRARKRSMPSPAPGIEAAMQAVRSLSVSDTTPTEWQEYHLETRAEHGDRGVAILLATNVENILRIAIRRWLQISDDLRREVFIGQQAPASSFSGKIIIAHAIGMFGHATRVNLDIIRVVRNAFAHARRPIKFTDPAIIKLCEFLVIPRIIRLGDFDGILNPEDNPPSPARYRFRVVCEHTIHNLTVHNCWGTAGIAEGALRSPLPYTGYEILARDEPLP